MYVYIEREIDKIITYTNCNKTIWWAWQNVWLDTTYHHNDEIATALQIMGYSPRSIYKLEWVLKGNFAQLKPKTILVWIEHIEHCPKPLLNFWVDDYII